MSRRLSPPEEFRHPKGLSFFSFASDHLDAIILPDLPTQAESGDVFAIIVENNPSITSIRAYERTVTIRCWPRSVRNSANEEVSLLSAIKQMVIS